MDSPPPPVAFPLTRSHAKLPRPNQSQIQAPWLPKLYTNLHLASHPPTQALLPPTPPFPSKTPKSIPPPHPTFPCLPPELLPLQIPERRISDRTERKREGKTDIASVPRGADAGADRADEPDLGHAHDGAEDAEAEGGDGGEARGQLGGGQVDGDVVAGEPALE